MEQKDASIRLSRDFHHLASILKYHFLSKGSKLFQRREPRPHTHNLYGVVQLILYYIPLPFVPHSTQRYNCSQGRLRGIKFLLQL